MTEKKYQVFISSTYQDLKEERRAVEETIIRSGDFPVGMEAFPAADDEQFDFIKTVISQCDYYILVIAGKYGSISPDGKSYTEKEYDYAVKIGVPVLVMVHENIDTIPANKTEGDVERRKQLDFFIEKVSTGRLRKTWNSADSLKLAVREALDHAKATKSRPGWIRGDHPMPSETLNKIVFLQDEVARLTARLEEVTPLPFLPDNLAGLETKFDFRGIREFSQSQSARLYTKVSFQIGTSFGEIFELLSPYLLEPIHDKLVGGKISKALWRRHHDDTGTNFSMQDEEFQTLKIQFMALNLISVDRMKLTNGSFALFWTLTKFGKEEMMRRRAMKTTSQESH